jgi:outer membrane protein OmpA-like peptidoglycan-associated protein
MRSNLKIVTTFFASAALLTGCATQHSVKRVRAYAENESRNRIAADSAFAVQMGALQGDVSQLRADLTSMRTEFGAKITAMEDGLKFAFPVNFAFNDASVRQEDQAALDRFAAVSQKYYPGAKITVEGFADPAGSQRYNLDLSKRRADAVGGYLTGKGVPNDVLRTIGYGKARLVVPGAQADQPGAEQNRRVVFVIESKGEAMPANQTAMAPATSGQ